MKHDLGGTVRIKTEHVCFHQSGFSWVSPLRIWDYLNINFLHSQYSNSIFYLRRENILLFQSDHVGGIDPQFDEASSISLLS